MVQISKDEAIKLNKLGINYGSNGISHTQTRYPKYYLCEKKDNLKKLNKIRMQG